MAGHLCQVRYSAVTFSPLLGNQKQCRTQLLIQHDNFLIYGRQPVKSQVHEPPEKKSLTTTLRKGRSRGAEKLNFCST